MTGRWPKQTAAETTEGENLRELMIFTNAVFSDKICKLLDYILRILILCNIRTFYFAKIKIPHTVANRGRFFASPCAVCRRWISSLASFWFGVVWNGIATARATPAARTPKPPLATRPTRMPPSRDSLWCAKQSREYTPPEVHVVWDWFRDQAVCVEPERKGVIVKYSFAQTYRNMFSTSRILMWVAISWMRWIVCTFSFHRLALPTGFPQHFWFSWLTIFCSCSARPRSTLMFCWLSLTEYMR